MRYSFFFKPWHIFQKLLGSRHGAVNFHVACECLPVVVVTILKGSKAVEGGLAWGAKPQGVWVTGVPSGVPGAEHRWGVWRRSSISHIFTYICLFFCACRHHSTKSVKWGAGHLISFAPPCLQMGATAHPALPPMLWLWLQYLIGPCQDG